MQFLKLFVLALLAFIGSATFVYFQIENVVDFKNDVAYQNAVKIPANVVSPNEGSVSASGVGDGNDAIAPLEETVKNESVEGKVVSKPAPLVKNINVTPSDPHTITISGVIAETNKQRVAHGLPALLENARLGNAAELKVDDMFQLQYFEHESPTGANVETLAARVGYAYVNIGENLAMGTFDGDADLVDAWMNSPGHRANILNPLYQEIGVSVKKGTYEGRTVWMAVQEFGRSLSACPSPSPELKAGIEQDQKTVDTLKAQLDVMGEELNSMSKQDFDAYNAKVNQYNTLVAQVNDLIASIKTRVAQYNEQVRAFNGCALPAGV